MSLYLAPADEADADRFAAIEQAALPDNDAASAVLFPGPFPTDDAAPSRGDQLREHLRSDAACRWVKVVDRALEAAGSGEDAIIAFAIWYFWDAQPKPLPEPIWGPGTNAAACTLCFGGLEERWHDDVGNKPHTFLKFMHTDPAHQRRGAGALMMAWGVAEADSKGLLSYTQASPQGRGLYAKFGFKLIDTHFVDLSAWGGPARDETAIMVRPVGAAHA